MPNEVYMLLLLLALWLSTAPNRPGGKLQSNMQGLPGCSCHTAHQQQHSLLHIATSRAANEYCSSSRQGDAIHR